MRYAKLASGYPSYAPRKLRVDDSLVYNPTGAMLLDAGYLPVVETAPPVTDEQHYATPHWAIENDRIVQRWEAKEIPIKEEEALTRYANELTGQNDPDLLSAAETLLTERIKEES